MRRLLLIVVLSSCPFPRAAYAQETPTERDAAKSVLQKLDALEKSLDVPALVAKLTAPNPAREAVVARAQALMQSELIALGDDITKHPEIGFKEQESTRKLIAWLEGHGFKTETGVAGLPTAFVSQWRGAADGPTLGIIVEYDSLRGTERAFHGDQHSTQGPIGLATAVATKEFMERSGTPGRIVVYGTPGEEMMPPVAKTVMYDAGVFNGADVIVRSHSSPTTSRPAPGFGTCCMNIDGVKFTFTGAPAHQLAAFNGRNALEGVIHLFENIDSVRSSMRPEARIQGVITEGGAAPNVVPDRAVADFYIRYPDEVYLRTIREFTDNAAKAAALSTGTKVQIDHYGSLRDGISVATLAEVGFVYMKQYGATNVRAEPGKPQGFEETGSVSRVIPGLEFSSQTSNAPNHTYEMESDALADVGHHGFTVDAQAMTALLYDFATRADYRAVVKREFDGIKALFDEYLASLEKTYKNPIVKDPDER
jgi:amidohydrolase